MRRTITRGAVMAGVLIALGSAAAPGLSQAPEGYDPLRQITAQLVKANLLIVLDTTGSMATDADGNNLTDGQYSIGRLIWKRTGPVLTAGDDPTNNNLDPGKDFKGNYRCSVLTTTTGGKATSWDKTNCSYWEYSLVFEAPSRIATVKNALGQYVSINPKYTPPANFDLVDAGNPFKAPWTIAAPKSAAPVKTQAKCTAMAALISKTSPAFVCLVDYGYDSSKPLPNAIYKADPSIPYDAYNTSGQPTGSFGGTMQTVAPQDVVGKNASKINWGLVAFSTSREHTPKGATPLCSLSELLVPIDTTDSNNVSTLESYLQLKTAPGVTVGGGTDTVAALKFAGVVLQTTYQGGTIVDAAGTSTTVPQDYRYDCNRTYGVILATDGLSNSCNTGATAGKNWISPCGTGPATCDVSPSSGNDCPSNWAKFAANEADQIWNLNLGSAAIPPKRAGSPINPRVWTIGVSPVVGPCELDFIAYMGRTDASSPNGDAGFGGYDVAKNPYLPNPASAVPASGLAPTYDGPTGQYLATKGGAAFNPQPGPPPVVAPYNSHGDNAFFATSTQAITQAITQIVNATALGDYTTNAPTSGSSVRKGNIVLLPSAEFPTWRGHLYQYLVVPNPDVTQPPIQTLQFDAGAVLASTPARNRKIYTWDPSKNPITLVPIDSSTPLATLQTIAGANGLSNPSTLTANVIDFIRGNDGLLTNTARAWKLGPLLNTTPAITGPPFAFKQTNGVKPHAGFESTYKDRKALAWVGSDDGMMHAFQFDTMAEELALLPPNLLALQVALFNNYDQVKKVRVTGQPDDIAAHLYGVASSLRFTDVWFKNDTYHTVGILTEGPGGTTMAAIDITHPSAGDISNVASSPVSILWARTGGSGAGQLNGLNNTWSVPAMAPSKTDTWNLIFGSGPNPSSKPGSQVDPGVFTLDLSSSPNPSNKAPIPLPSLATPSPLVGNQAFAASVFFRTDAPAYYSDNLADLGLQADLNGRIWFMSTSNNLGTAYVGIDATAIAGNKSQPIYYPPAVSGLGSKTDGCDLFAFGSGSFYEKNPSVSETKGPSAIGTSPRFIPSLYIAVNPKPPAGSPAAAITTALAANQVTRVQLASQVFAGGITLGAHTQVTAPPFLIVPLSGTGAAQALFIVYDPDNGCSGRSWVISITFNLGATCGDPVRNVSYAAYDAGVGAASGFTIVNDTVAVAKSGVGKDSSGNPNKASLFVTSAKVQTGASSKVVPVWWKELK